MTSDDLTTYRAVAGTVAGFLCGFGALLILYIAGLYMYVDSPSLFFSLTVQKKDVVLCERGNERKHCKHNRRGYQINRHLSSKTKSLQKPRG